MTDGKGKNLVVLCSVRMNQNAIIKFFQKYALKNKNTCIQYIQILALRGALKFFAVLNVLGEDFMVFWREHDELFNRFPEEFKNSKSFPSGPFYFRFVLPDSLF